MVLCNLSQNFKINWVPLADTIRLDTPCKQTILDKYNYASCGLVYVVLTGLKLATLVSQFTITQ
jgi:hypothetical protein